MALCDKKSFFCMEPENKLKLSTLRPKPQQSPILSPFDFPHTFSPSVQAIVKNGTTFFHEITPDSFISPTIGSSADFYFNPYFAQSFTSNTPRTILTGNNIYIRGLPPTMNDATLKEICSQYFNII